jgi:hypothetical protein
MNAIRPPDFRTCQFCSAMDLHFRWQRFVNGNWHLRAKCLFCGKFLGYAPQTAEFLKQAPLKPNEDLVHE